MTEIKFPALKIPATIRKGILLNVELLGVKIRIPPSDIVLFKEDLTIWGEFTLFDTDWIVYDVLYWMRGIPNAVWDVLESKLEEMVDDYYDVYPEEHE